jgi:hypothetical protein
MGEKMNCTEFHDLLVIGIHGRLSPEQWEEIDRHRSACAECAALHERLKRLMDLQAKALEEAATVPTPDWDASWAAIAKRALPEKSPVSRFFGRVPRWIPATAGILVIFVLGYVAGRSILVDSVTSRPGIAGLSPSDRGPSLLFASYADSLKPVLTSFLNRGDVVPPAELRALEREIVRDMLSRTRILQDLATASGDAELADLLLDLEFILTSLANLAPGDKASAALLDRMIREKDVPLRLRELASPMTI